MPNWPLSQEIRDHIRNRAQTLANRMVDLNRLDFPLNVQQLQEGASGLTIRQIELIKQLEKEGLETIRKASSLRVGFLREVFPELKRSMTLEMSLPNAIYVRHTQFGRSSSTSDWREGTKTHIVATMDNLTPEERAKLIAWLDKLLRQVRIYEIVNQCVNTTLNSSTTPTAGHLKYLWPALATVIEPLAVSRHNNAERQRIEAWVERFRNPPMRGLSRYENDGVLFTQYRDLLKLADMQIAGGHMMQDVSLNKHGAIYPVIDNWERIPGDIVFPLLRKPT